MTPAPKPIGIALSGAQTAALLQDRGLARRLDECGATFAVAGIDRIDERAEHGTTIESTIAVTTLAARTTRIGWLAGAAAHRDHPYNLARRLASADHLSNGRTGVLLGQRDAYAPGGPPGREVWGGAGLGNGAPVGPDTTADAAQAMRKLWQTWPAGSIVFDKATRIYANGDAILHADHHGAFDIAGPLTVPTTPQGSPVLAWRATSLVEAAIARGAAELLVWPIGGYDSIATVAPLPGSARLFAEVPVTGDDCAHLAAGLLAGEQVAGVLLRAEPSTDALERLLADTFPRLREHGAIREPIAGVLRTNLSLPAPAPLLAGARPAFPAPTPHYDASVNVQRW